MSLRYKVSSNIDGFRGMDTWHFKRGGVFSCVVCLCRFKTLESKPHCTACGGVYHPKCGGAALFTFQNGTPPFNHIRLNACAACVREWSS